MVSADMEGVEMWHAERVGNGERVTTVGETEPYPEVARAAAELCPHGPSHGGPSRTMMSRPSDLIFCCSSLGSELTKAA